MKTIEINTAQKVTIQYGLATLSNRFLAYLVDWVLVGIVIVFLMVLGESAFSFDETKSLYAFLVIVPIVTLYALLAEIFMHGQTVGKRVMGLKVVRLNGDAPTNHDYVMRWMFRFIDIWLSLGSVGALLINASPKSQRLGGLLSGTTVIRTTAQRTFSLNDILKISTIDNYEPQFPAIRAFSEQDMLFIKRVLERERRHPNAAHQKAVRELAEHVAQKLNFIGAAPKDSSKFLRTLINDYIVLTR